MITPPGPPRLARLEEPEQQWVAGTDVNERWQPDMAPYFAASAATILTRVSGGSARYSTWTELPAPRDRELDEICCLEMT